MQRGGIAPEAVVLPWRVMHDHVGPVDDAFVAAGATLIGGVRIGTQASVWYGSVLRGDSEQIVIGAQINLQDGCGGARRPGLPVVLGERVTVGPAPWCTAAASTMTCWSAWGGADEWRHRRPAH